MEILAKSAHPPRPARGFARLAIAFTALLAISGIAACGDDGSGPQESTDGGKFAQAPEFMTRVAFARTYLHTTWTLGNETPQDVGDALAGLKPTWVPGLVRYENGESPTEDQVSAYDEIRSAVRAAEPDAQFGIELNALEYPKPDKVVAMMRKLRAKFDNDGWFFDFFTPAYEKRPDVVRAAIKEAKSNGEWIGGNAFGLSKGDPKVPPGSDFLAVTDSNFELDVAAVRGLAEKVPVLVHTSNSPGHNSSEGCVYIRDYDFAKREAYVRERAEQQAEGHFSFAYPVFFPTCGLGNGDIVSYNSLEDPPMLSTLDELMTKYN